MRASAVRKSSNSELSLVNIVRKALEEDVILDRSARFLVDAYFNVQKHRARLEGQHWNYKEGQDTEDAALGIIKWLRNNLYEVEQEIKKALAVYVQEHPIGEWMMGIYGVGPVISAGLLSHIDITKAQTAGAIWRFAGLDPTVKWEKGQKRPFNMRLKVICYYAGSCFQKFSGRDECFYGKIYAKRRLYEIEKNERLEYKDQAAELAKRVGKNTNAYKFLSQGKLSPAHINARAMRYAVKLFLSHLHEVWYTAVFKERPPKPFPIAIQGHAHYIPPPNVDGFVFDGEDEVIKIVKENQEGLEIES
jgi:hypothetical protein